MHYLIKFIFFFIICNNLLANENKTNEILFQINNKVFTNIDLEERKDYVALVNNLIKSEFSKLENNEILEDYISSLIFYEYYIQNKIVLKNLNNEIDKIFTKIQKTEELKLTKIKNFKINAKIDIVRNKIIEEKLNLEKNNLLQNANKLDLLYNYNLQYIIINENLIDQEIIQGIDTREKFNKLKDYIIKNKINFFYKEEDINNNAIISNKIKSIIKQDTKIYSNNENGYINLISVQKNLESYEGIFVKLINFKSSKLYEKEDLQCNKLNEKIDIKKTVFKEYEYSKLNTNIRNNLKSINDNILFDDNDEYNYIVLCDLTYDENLLKNINFNKNVNSLVDKIQRNFLKKYKNEYRFKKIK